MDIDSARSCNVAMMMAVLVSMILQLTSFVPSNANALAGVTCHLDNVCFEQAKRADTCKQVQDQPRQSSNYRRGLLQPQQSMQHTAHMTNIIGHNRNTRTSKAPSISKSKHPFTKLHNRYKRQPSTHATTWLLLSHLLLPWLAKTGQARLHVCERVRPQRRSDASASCLLCRCCCCCCSNCNSCTPVRNVSVLMTWQPSHSVWMCYWTADGRGLVQLQKCVRRTPPHNNNQRQQSKHTNEQSSIHINNQTHSSINQCNHAAVAFAHV